MANNNFYCTGLSHLLLEFFLFLVLSLRCFIADKSNSEDGGGSSAMLNCVNDDVSCLT